MRSSTRSGRDVADLPEEAALAVIAALDGVGPARFRWMLSFGSAHEVLDRIRNQRLPRPPGQLRLDPALLAKWSDAANAADAAQVWAECERRGIGVAGHGTAAYPPRLVEDPEAPAVVFHLGDPDVLCARTVAIVGTRRPTGYGRRVATELGRELSAAGIAVVSGLALGIDVVAHRGALSHEAAAPVAVVAAGLDAPCPVRNRDTAAAVVERGLLLSEVPPGTGALPWRFPVRNRIVAALADAIVVVESAPTGGSMHTVREALERDVPVLAVPGPIDSDVSTGTNELLREGAHPFLDVGDVFGVLGVTPPKRGAPSAERADPRPPVGPTAAQVLSEIGWRPMTVGAIATACELGVKEVSAAISELEAAGRAHRRGGWIERIAR